MENEGGEEEGQTGGAFADTPADELSAACSETPLHRALLDMNDEQGSAIRSERPATGTYTSLLWSCLHPAWRPASRLLSTEQ